MPRNGSGSYSPPAASFPAVPSTLIESTKFNAVINDIATALTGSIAADGQTTVTANQSMSGYKHVSVANAASATDYAAAGQVVKNAFTYAASSAGSDSYSINLLISPGSLSAGYRFQFLADVDNTGACTLDVNSIGATAILLADGSTPHNGAIQANSIADVVYDGTQFLLLNPSYADSIASAVVNASTTLQIGGVSISATAAEINLLHGITAGTVAASKFVLVDASKDIGNFGIVTATSFVGALTGNVTGNVTGNLTGNVTGNVTGSSGSCTGNSATATLANSIAANTVTDAKVYWESITTESSFTVANNSSTVIPAGLYIYLSTDLTSFLSGYLSIQLQGHAGWVGAVGKSASYNTSVAFDSIYSDGTNIRMYNNALGGTATVYYKKLA